MAPLGAVSHRFNFNLIDEVEVEIFSYDVCHPSFNSEFKMSRKAINTVFCNCMSMFGFILYEGGFGIFKQ